MLVFGCAPTFVEDCLNGQDDDDDGFADCKDLDCDSLLICQDEICDNNIDDNGDGILDCADPGCSGDPRCRCGNGILDVGEECDGQNLGGQSCASLGLGGGALGCELDCSFDTSGCVQPGCGNNVLDPGEGCDDGNTTNGDGCNQACQLEICGNGVLDAGEECDDGDTTPGDGCDQNCQIEEGGACAHDLCVEGAALVEGCDPCVTLVCAEDEFCCNNAWDNLCVGQAVDLCGLDCTPEVFGFACLAGETLVQLSSSDVPVGIVDLEISLSDINVTSAGTVKRVIVGVDNIAHPFVGDLEIFLASPLGTLVELSTDNGSSGDNYISTIFDNNCLFAGNGSIIGKSAPFTGCFAPEGSLTDFSGEPSSGVWTLVVADDAIGDEGSLNAWTLGLCIQ